MKLKPFIRRLKILNTDREVIPFTLNWAQDHYVSRIEAQYNANKPMRFIILKARQMGLSTATEAFLFTMSFLHTNNRSLVISHDQTSYEHLLGMSKRYWSTFWARRLYHTDYSSRKELAWKETSSSIFTATAKSVDAARSQTVHGLHASEVAFWPDPKTLMTGLRQTIPTRPGTFIALESTANGVGNYFHTTWNAAMSGDSEFEPLFFPWWKHPEYTAPTARLPTVLGPLNSEERLLYIYLRSQGCSDPEHRIIWHRFALRDLCQNDMNKLHQEYPTTPEEAFVASGSNVFPLDKLNEIYRRNEGTRGYIHLKDDRPIFTPSAEGTAAVFRWPSRSRDYGKYIVSGDPTHTTRGDYAVIQVIHRRTFEVVARIRLRCTPVQFAQHLVAVARYYNDALLVAESTGPGYATIGAIMQMGYPFVWQGHWLDKTPGSMSDRFGFETNVARKAAAVGYLLQVIVDGTLLLHDPITYQELVNYVTLDSGGYGPNSRDGFDDCVMSLAIGVLCTMLEPPLPPVGSESNPSVMEDLMNPVNTDVPGYNEMVGAP